MMRIDAKQCFKRSARIICKEMEGAPVLMDPYRRMQISLNPVAMGIWQSLDGHHSVADILEKLTQEFDVGTSMLEKDVAGFLQELVKREMVE